MRTPIELAVQMATPIEAKPGATPRDGASVSRPFADILAEADAVQDVVQLGGRETLRDSAQLPAFRDAWNGLCRGVDRLWAAGVRPSPALRSGLRRIGR